MVSSANGNCQASPVCNALQHCSIAADSLPALTGGCLALHTSLPFGLRMFSLLVRFNAPVTCNELFMLLLLNHCTDFHLTFRSVFLQQHGINAGDIKKVSQCPVRCYPAAILVHCTHAVCPSLYISRGSHSFYLAWPDCSPPDIHLAAHGQWLPHC